MSSSSVTPHKHECNEASEDLFQNTKEQVPSKKKAKQRMIIRRRRRIKMRFMTQKSTTIQHNREEVKQTSNITSTKKMTLALGETIGWGCAEVCERKNKEKESGKGRGREVIAVAPRKEDKGKHSATVCGRKRRKENKRWGLTKKIGGEKST
jgi:hypothetical protein